MKKNIGESMAASDMPTVAQNLATIATFAPPGYTNWVSISKDGEAAARTGDVMAVKASCRGCHSQYRSKYKGEMRSRPLP
jgi:hypothetical protein